jgi:hypothetical protein
MINTDYYLYAIIGLVITLLISVSKHIYDWQNNRKEDANTLREKISSLLPKLETLKTKPQSKNKQPSQESLILKEEILSVINSIDTNQLKEKTLSEFQTLSIELDDAMNSMIYTQTLYPIDNVKTKIKSFCKQLSRSSIKIL